MTKPTPSCETPKKTARLHLWGDVLVEHFGDSKYSAGAIPAQQAGA